MNCYCSKVWLFWYVLFCSCFSLDTLCINSLHTETRFWQVIMLVLFCWNFLSSPSFPCFSFHTLFLSQISVSRQQLVFSLLLLLMLSALWRISVRTSLPKPGKETTTKNTIATAKSFGPHGYWLVCSFAIQFLCFSHRSITKTVVNSEIRKEIGENQKVHVVVVYPFIFYSFFYHSFLLSLPQ